MHYKTEVVKMELEPLERFLKQTGLKEMVTQPKLSVTKSTLPPETKGAVALDYPAGRAPRNPVRRRSTNQNPFLSAKLAEAVG